MIFASDAVRVGFTVRNADGELQNADSLPTGALRVNGSSDGTTVTVTNVATGHYEASFTAAAWTVGHAVQLTISATVDGLADKAVVMNDVVRTGSGGLVQVTTSSDSNSAIATAVGLASPIALASGGVDTVTTQTTYDLNWPLGGIQVNGIDLVGATIVLREGANLNQRTITSSVRLSDSRLTVIVDAAPSWTITDAATYVVKDRPFPPNFPALGITAGGYVNGTFVDSSEFNDEAVPPSRKWNVRPSRDDDEGLVGDRTLTLTVGDDPTFAVDFAKDLPANVRVSVVDTPTIYELIEDGAAGGVTFGVTGREDSEAKVRITGVTAGTYKLEFKVEYSNGDPQTARVILKVND